MNMEETNKQKKPWRREETNQRLLSFRISVLQGEMKEKKGMKVAVRLSLYPEIALHKGHLQILAKTVLWPH